MVGFSLEINVKKQEFSDYYMQYETAQSSLLCPVILLCCIIEIIIPFRLWHNVQRD